MAYTSVDPQIFNWDHRIIPEINSRPAHVVHPPNDERSIFPMTDEERRQTVRYYEYQDSRIGPGTDGNDVLLSRLNTVSEKLHQEARRVCKTSDEVPPTWEFDSGVLVSKYLDASSPEDGIGTTLWVFFDDFAWVAYTRREDNDGHHVCEIMVIQGFGMSEPDDADPVLTKYSWVEGELDRIGETGSESAKLAQQIVWGMNAFSVGRTAVASSPVVYHGDDKDVKRRVPLEQVRQSLVPDKKPDDDDKYNDDEY